VGGAPSLILIFLVLFLFLFDSGLVSMNVDQFEVEVKQRLDHALDSRWKNSTELASGPSLVAVGRQAAIRFTRSVGVLLALISFAATAVMPAFTNT